ncbi:hypothetical protein AAMO2058_000343400 [Amorphochlora amoebiformis]
MCRWMAYKGSPVKLNTLLTFPENSIVNQAKDARYHPGCNYQSVEIAEKRNNRVNADGFGVAWYPIDSDEKLKESCVFRSTQPSWGDLNLLELAKHVKSDAIFAHVRAMTSPGIQHFARIKRKLQSMLEDEFFEFIGGSTDSENIFALFLSILKRELKGLGCKTRGRQHVSTPLETSEKTSGMPTSTPPSTRNGLKGGSTAALRKLKDSETGRLSPSLFQKLKPRQIAKALNDTIQTIVDLVTEYSANSHCSLNLAVTNGTAIIATRFRRGKSPPPSLYFAMLKQIQGCDGKIRIWAKNDGLHEGVKELQTDCVIVSSEPLTRDPCWNLVGESTMIVVHGDANNRSKAGKVELISMNIRKCFRSSPYKYTCRPWDRLRCKPRSLPVSPSQVVDKSQEEKEKRVTSAVRMPLREDSDGDTNIPPLLLTPYHPKKAGMPSRLEDVRIANSSSPSKKALSPPECPLSNFMHTFKKRLLTHLPCPIQLASNTIRALDPAMVIGLALVAQRKGLWAHIKRARFLNFLLLTVTYGLYLRKHLRGGDMMWLLILASSAR